ncbi:MAG: zinc dependent phospholipase C family protein [Veillonellales bacterium]
MLSLPVLKKASLIIGCRMVLTAVSPLQGIIDRPGITHEFCNRQALEILRQDGFTQCAAFLAQYSKQLNAGVYWADTGWKNAGHYFQPVSRKGLWHFDNARHDYYTYLRGAVISARKQDYGKAAFFLGAAAHLVQDVCVPHHARAKLFSGHKEYEAWAQEHYLTYAAASQGIYRNDRRNKDWIVVNATVAADLFDWVNSDRGNLAYHSASAVLLPLAQRSTAGLFQLFYGIISHNAQHTVVA